MLYLLDTNICSAVIKRHSDADSKLAALDPADVCISAVTYSELRFGVALAAPARRLEALVDEFLACVRCEPWDQLAADRHGTLRAHLRLTGRPIGQFDEMIAAHALALQAVVVTNNEKHFRQVPGLKVVNWIQR
jgi:tRNA(fMet)-specific endonuclease VapC